MIKCIRLFKIFSNILIQNIYHLFNMLRSSYFSTFNEIFDHPFFFYNCTKLTWFWRYFCNLKIAWIMKRFYFCFQNVHIFDTFSFFHLKPMYGFYYNTKFLPYFSYISFFIKFRTINWIIIFIPFLCNWTINIILTYLVN